MNGYQVGVTYDARDRSGYLVTEVRDDGSAAVIYGDGQCGIVELPRYDDILRCRRPECDDPIPAFYRKKVPDDGPYCYEHWFLYDRANGFLP